MPNEAGQKGFWRICTATPEYFHDYAADFLQAGAQVLGGCCGTTPKHSSIMRQAIDAYRPDAINPNHSLTIVEREEAEQESHAPTVLAQKLTGGKFAVAVEMDPPRGLTTQKILAGSSLLAKPERIHQVDDSRWRACA